MGSEADTGAQSAVKAARFDRRVSYQQESWVRGQQDAARWKEELRNTGAYWTENCIQCFVDGQDFHHAKGTCQTFTGDLVRRYRFDIMGNNLGKPLCFTCFMPISLCAKWTDAETGDVRSRPGPGLCTYPHTVLDTWACLWDQCTKAKAIWLNRIAEQTDSQMDGEDTRGFQEYFRTMVRMGNRELVGRICADVNWFTQVYFLAEGELWRDLQPEGST